MHVYCCVFKEARQLFLLYGWPFLFLFIFTPIQETPFNKVSHSKINLVVSLSFYSISNEIFPPILQTIKGTFTREIFLNSIHISYKVSAQIESFLLHLYAF